MQWIYLNNIYLKEFLYLLIKNEVFELKDVYHPWLNHLVIEAPKNKEILKFVKIIDFKQDAVSLLSNFVDVSIIPITLTKRSRSSYSFFLKKYMVLK